MFICMKMINAHNLYPSIYFDMSVTYKKIQNCLYIVYTWSDNAQSLFSILFEQTISNPVNNYFKSCEYVILIFYKSHINAQVSGFVRYFQGTPWLPPNYKSIRWFVM